MFDVSSLTIDHMMFVYTIYGLGTRRFARLSALDTMERLLCFCTTNKEAFPK